MDKVKELELKLLATSKELEECKALAEYNDKRFKNHLANCQCSREMKEAEVALRKKDDELVECKETMSKNEEMTRQNQIRINNWEAKWASQVVQIEILRNKAEVVEEELNMYDWRINWNELIDSNGCLDSTPFRTASDLYCLSLSVEYNKFHKGMVIYLHRYRDHDEVGGIPTDRGFDYAIYVVCNNKVVDRDSGSLMDFSCFHIGRAYARSRGFVCLELDSDYIDHLRCENFHIFCLASRPGV